MNMTMKLPGKPRRKQDAHAQARIWLLTLTSGKATEDDAEDFRLWLRADPAHEAAFAQEKKLWRALGPAVQEELAARAATPARRSVLTGRRAFLGGAVAASAAWLALRPPLGLWPGLGELSADYRSAPGEQRRVALNDALEVDLNTQTRINVMAGEQGTVIELVDGEAEVRAGAALAEVVAGAGRVRARDARFNLRYLGGEARLCCLSGKLALAHAQGVFELGAGNELRYTASGVLPPVPVDTERVTAWRQGWLVFDQEPLSQVVDEINRYRRGRLVLMNEQLGKRLVQARISLAQVADAERLIRDAYGARLTHLPAGVVLLS